MTYPRMAVLAITILVCTALWASPTTTPSTVITFSELGDFYWHHPYLDNSADLTKAHWVTSLFEFKNYSDGWEADHSLFGDKPSIYCQNCDPGAVEVTGGQFTFFSVDIGNPNLFVSHTYPYSITGYLNGVLVLSQSGDETINPSTFNTLTSVDNSIILDQLIISVDSTGTVVNLDNIGLGTAPVPEPGTLFLSLTGCMCAAASARFRARGRRMSRLNVQP